MEVGGRRLVVDCGVRMGFASSVDPLPNLAALQDLGGVDAILVTHAHLDHTGALPVLHQAFPAAPVYATPATHALVNIMLGDALKVMADRCEREHEVPLYAPEQNAIKERARQLIPPAWGLVREPGFFKALRSLKVKLRSVPDGACLSEVSARLEQETGYRIVEPG